MTARELPPHRVPHQTLKTCRIQHSSWDLHYGRLLHRSGEQREKTSLMQLLIGSCHRNSTPPGPAQVDSSVGLYSNICKRL